MAFSPFPTASCRETDGERDSGAVSGHFGGLSAHVGRHFCLLRASGIPAHRRETLIWARWAGAPYSHHYPRGHSQSSRCPLEFDRCGGGPLFPGTARCAWQQDRMARALSLEAMLDSPLLRRPAIFNRRRRRFAPTCESRSPRISWTFRLLTSSICFMVAGLTSRALLCFPRYGAFITVPPLEPDQQGQYVSLLLQRITELAPSEGRALTLKEMERQHPRLDLPFFICSRTKKFRSSMRRWPPIWKPRTGRT